MKTYTIYRARNVVNDKVYIGFTSRWPNRISGHDYDCRYNKSQNKAFYNAIKKYGWDNFVWEAIYQSKDCEHTLKVMEPHFIEEYCSWVGSQDCNGYNVTKGGEGTTGWKRPDELIESHRKQMTGRKFTAEHIANRVASFKKTMAGKGTMSGKTHSEETKGKIRQAHLSKPKSEEHKKAMRNRPQDTIRLTCPHCAKEGDYKNMKRWHMDNCKVKK